MTLGDITNQGGASRTTAAATTHKPAPPPPPHARDRARRLERDVALVGQELHSFDDVFDGGAVRWDFAPHLDATLAAALAAAPADHRAYVFGVTEPQQFNLPPAAAAAAAAGSDGSADTDGERCSKTVVVPIPVLVVLIAAAPPPSLLGITSVQSSTERVVEMRSLKVFFCFFEFMFKRTNIHSYEFFPHSRCSSDQHRPQRLPRLRSATYATVVVTTGTRSVACAPRLEPKGGD